MVGSFKKWLDWRLAGFVANNYCFQCFQYRLSTMLKEITFALFHSSGCEFAVVSESNKMFSANKLLTETSAWRQKQYAKSNITPSVQSKLSLNDSDWFTYKWIIIIRFFSVNQKHTDQPKSKFQTNYSWAGYPMNSSTTCLTDLFNSSLKQVDQSAYRINTHLLNYMLSLFSEKSVSKLNMFCLSKLANWLSIVHVYEYCQVD